MDAVLLHQHKVLQGIVAVSAKLTETLSQKEFGERDPFVFRELLRCWKPTSLWRWRLGRLAIKAVFSLCLHVDVA